MSRSKRDDDMEDVTLDGEVDATPQPPAVASLARHDATPDPPSSDGSTTNSASPFKALPPAPRGPTSRSQLSPLDNASLSLPSAAHASTSSLHSTEPSSPDSASTPALVYGVCLVGFDHALGPTVEYAWPDELNKNSQLLAEHLPFFALPDGAHARNFDYSYFHLHLPSVASSTVFGISCNSQIQATELLNKGSEVTRSTVQKAIVVLASKPIFGPLRDKLGVITRAFFAQKDFADKSILVDLFTSLEVPQSAASGERIGEGGEEGRDSSERAKASAIEESRGEEGGMYMGTSLRELVYKFRAKTLQLLKILMLQRRVMFYAAHTSVETLCNFQYSLVALVPALLTHLEDAATPALDSRAHRITRPSTLRTSDKSSLIRYIGLPLNIFGAGAFFQPYLPLQQIDMLKTKSYLVGTTNSIFQQQRDCKIDVLVNIESASIDILDPKLTPLLTLTAADRKWMDEIVTTVDNSWNSADPTRPIGGNFIGSDDFLRAKFEEYICSMLACIKFTDYLKTTERADILLSEKDLDSNMMRSFNESYIRAFKVTPAFELWNSTTDSAIFDLVEPRHPMEGKTNAIEDVGIRLAHGLHDLHLEENLAPTREAISRGVSTGSDALWKTYSFLRTETSKRQTEFQRGELAPPPILTNTVLAGVDVAKTGAATLATGIGSLFASSKRTLFSRGADAEPVPAPAPAPRSRPVSSSGYPPTPTAGASPPGPGQGSLFRPLSTASAASVPVTNPENLERRSPNSLSTPSFFNPFRRNVSDPPSTSPAVSRTPSPRPTPPLKPVDKGAETADLKIRDLDAEFESRASRSSKSTPESGYPPPPSPERRLRPLSSAPAPPPSSS